MWEKFVEATTRHFRFLETEFGFTSKTAKPPFAIYESNKVQVLVYYDVNGRHELDLRVRNLSDDPRKIPAVGMTEMMLPTDWQPAEKYQSPFPSTEASLEIEIQRLADLVRKYSSAFLKGDEGAFERIERLRGNARKSLEGRIHPSTGKGKPEMFKRTSTIIGSVWLGGDPELRLTQKPFRIMLMLCLIGHR